MSFAGQAIAAGNAVLLEIYDKTTNEVLSEYAHKRDTWVKGERNHIFQLGLRNTTNSRLLAVLSVDGLNVINGKTADFNQPGYILPPYGSITISGWRKSLNKVAQFYFTSPTDSYATRTLNPDNIGIFGMAVFAENEPIPQPAEYMDQPFRAPAPASARSGKSMLDSYNSAGLGTGHGSQIYDRVQKAEFDKQAIPLEVVTVRYDTRQNLISRGILHPRYTPPKDGPNAFPLESFTPDPKF